MKSADEGLLELGFFIFNAKNRDKEQFRLLLEMALGPTVGLVLILIKFMCIVVNIVFIVINVYLLL